MTHRSLALLCVCGYWAFKVGNASWFIIFEQEVANRVVRQLLDAMSEEGPVFTYEEFLPSATLSASLLMMTTPPRHGLACSTTRRTKTRSGQPTTSSFARRMESLGRSLIVFSAILTGLYWQPAACCVPDCWLDRLHEHSPRCESERAHGAMQ